MLLQTTFSLTGDCPPELVLSLVQIKLSPTHCYRLFIDCVNRSILSFSVMAYPLLRDFLITRISQEDAFKQQDEVPCGGLWGGSLRAPPRPFRVICQLPRQAAKASLVKLRR